MKDGKSDAAVGQYRKAAIGGHSGAQLELGYKYLYGQDVNQNLRRARYWLEQAAEQGEAEAEDLIHVADEKLAECERIAASR